MNKWTSIDNIKAVHCYTIVLTHVLLCAIHKAKHLFVSHVTSVAKRIKPGPPGNHVDWGCVRICRSLLGLS